MNELSEYEYLWDGSDPGWVLVADDDAEPGVEFVVYNKNRKTMLVIEDASVSKVVSERMLSIGVEILPEVPKTEFRLEDIEIEESGRNANLNATWTTQRSEHS